MSWRTVVISSSAKLDYQMGYLIVRNQDVVKIHISEISILMIETTSVSLTAALLCELTKKKIKVIFCDEKRNPSSELIPYYGSHDTSMKVRKQIAWSEDIKTSVWTEIVTEKIRKQAENLERWDRTEAQMLYEYITQIEFGDATNREGHAAKVYFNALFGLDFTRTAENSINRQFICIRFESFVNSERCKTLYLFIVHMNMFESFVNSERCKTTEKI